MCGASSVFRHRGDLCMMLADFCFLFIFIFRCYLVRFVTCLGTVFYMQNGRCMLSRLLYGAGAAGW